MASAPGGRKSNRGSIDRLPSGALRVRVFAGYDPVSKKRRDLVELVPPGPNAERQAEKVRTRLLNQVDEQRHPRTNATVDQLIEKYLDVANLDPGTLRGYRRNYKNHVRPFIGKSNAGAIDAETLDSLYAELRRCRDHCDSTKRIDHRTEKEQQVRRAMQRHECEPLGDSTIRRIHFLLSGAFATATIELPGSGARPWPLGVNDARAELRQAIAASRPLSDDIVDRLVLPFVEAAVPEW